MTEHEVYHTLIDALRPVAALAAQYHDLPDDAPVVTGTPNSLKVGDLRRAAAALALLKRHRPDTPIFAPGTRVRVVGEYRRGQHGEVLRVIHKDALEHRLSHSPNAYTVRFSDGDEWVFEEHELQQNDDPVWVARGEQ